MHSHNLTERAIYVLAGFSTYMRPGENITLAIEDILPPVKWKDATDVRPTDFWTILLKPFERGELTKNKSFDEAIALDDTRMPWLGAALGAHAQRRLVFFRSCGMGESEAKAQRLWSFSQAAVLKSFQHAGRALEMEFLTKSLYVLRHSGVSRDVALKLRSLPEAQRRGNWAVASSLRNYENTQGCNGSLTVWAAT